MRLIEAAVAYQVPVIKAIAIGHSEHLLFQRSARGKFAGFNGGCSVFAGSFTAALPHVMEVVSLLGSTSVTDNNTALGNYGGSLMALPLVAGGAPGMMGTCGASNASAVGTANPCLNANDFFDINTSPAFPALSALRRNQYRGPGYFDFDMSLFKYIRLTERFTFALGAQAFNIFNHPNFNNPDSGFGDTTFGQISTMVNTPTSPYGTFLGFDASPRVLQLSMKLLF